MNNIYECPLYKLMLSQRNASEKIINESNLLFEDLTKFNFSIEMGREKIREQFIKNQEILKFHDFEILKFHHCKECLLESDNEKRI